MKKLEKLGSKLFEEFRGDEVSELASVLGGVSWRTLPAGRPEDTHIQSSTLKEDGATSGQADIVLSHLSCDGITKLDNGNIGVVVAYIDESAGF